MGGAKRKSRVFAPVTLKMIYEAAPRPDDVLEIEGENIADVSDCAVWLTIQIIIVGRVVERNFEPMRTLFTINDNTGTLKVIFY